MRNLDRQTIIEWRAQGIGSPMERLKFLREQMGSEWPDQSPSSRIWPGISNLLTGRRWMAAASATGLTLLLVSGVLMAGFEFRHPESMPMSRSMILPPPAVLSSEAANEPGVWLVDQKGEIETFSNGLRVENRHAVSTQARGKYRVYSPENLTPTGQYLDHPAGIVFHTTESDEVPFQAGQDRTLKRIGLEVLRLVQQNRSYHFLIDRFGRVFRVVREEDVAFHAGNSVWADTERVYVGLNTSFLGVAIETQTQAGQDTASANAAQIYAARVLTQMLRNKYHIAASNCVTHAQVSVNPVNGLIGYHTDWAANFPFLALGLRDNYMEPPASMVVFGFGYDPGYLRSTGTRLLPGLLRADNQVRAKAVRLGLDVQHYKALLQMKFTQITANSRPGAGTKEKEGRNNAN